MKEYPEYSNYEQFCPRCRRKGAPVKEGEFYVYPCGTVFNGEMGTFTHIACEFKHVTPEEALREAELVHRTFRHPEIKHEYQANKPLLGGPDFYQVAKYLLWDANLLLSVMDKAESFLGTTVEFTEPMNQIWVVDPALVSNDEHMVIGTAFYASQHALGMVQMLQPMAGWPMLPPFIRWIPPYHWGRPIESHDQARVAAIYTWLQQPYVMQSEAIHHSRQVKRNAERKGEILHNISVIEFRRPEGSRSSKTTEEPTRELHCCYERSGHTRRQPYGPKNSLRRVQWIAPTFVGDPDKPFKVKGQKLYKVSR